MNNNHARGTVTAATPSLRVLLDGHTNDVPASLLDGAAVNLGDRVNVLLRTPLRPLVLGREATVADSSTAGATQEELANAIAASSVADRARANHTGTQLASTVSDFTEAVQDAVAALITAGANATVTYDDLAGTLTIAATSSTDAEAVRDIVGAAIVGGTNITVTVNDTADTITISTTATVNSSDAYLLDRSHHTGTQSADSVTDGVTNKAYTATEKTKLAGIATGATANDTDANLKNRANHTGTQLAATISDFLATAVATRDLRRTGIYYLSRHSGNSSTLALTQDFALAIPFVIPEVATLDSLAVEVTTAAAAGGLLRFGLYTDSGVGVPDALVADLGTVASDSTGVKVKSFSQAVSAGLLWVVCVPQVATCTVRGMNGSIAPVTWGSTVFGASSEMSAYRQSPVTGALPSSWTQTNIQSSAPRLWIRRSA